MSHCGKLRVNFHRSGWLRVFVLQEGATNREIPETGTPAREPSRPTRLDLNKFSLTCNANIAANSAYFIKRAANLRPPQSGRILFRARTDVPSHPFPAVSASICCNCSVSFWISG
jgi:hypothetical protein